MGILTSAIDWSGNSFNGCLLGEPVVTEDGYLWDDALLPDGMIDENGDLYMEEPDA